MGEGYLTKIYVGEGYLGKIYVGEGYFDINGRGIFLSGPIQKEEYTENFQKSMYFLAVLHQLNETF